MLFDTSWPVLLFLMTVAYVLTWSLGVLSLDLSVVLWTTFGLALGYQLLSRILDYLPSLQSVTILHTAVNVLAVTGLAVIWTMLGGLASPAFAMFFALPITALGVVSRFSIQFGITVYSIIAAWVVAIRGSAELRLQLESLGFPRLWDYLPGTNQLEFAGYGAVTGGNAQLQFMIVFSFALLGIAATSAITVILIGRLFERLKFASASGERAAKISDSFVSDTNDLELILDRDEQVVIAISPKLADVLHETPESVIGCHVTSVLPFHSGHPARRMIESGKTGELKNQGLTTPGGCHLLNIRTHAGSSNGYEFQRVTFNELSAREYAELSIDLLGELYGAIDGNGRLQYLSTSLQKLTGMIAGDRADQIPMPAGWWQIGARRQHRRTVPMNANEYELRLHREEYYGDHSLTEIIVFRLQPAGGHG
ncbi:MAG: hypothetical protein HKN77_07075 [Woeseiaceae bacterium]|nr:hypothetical protein [Woeseiaceae bacterium]